MVKVSARDSTRLYFPEVDDVGEGQTNCMKCCIPFVCPSQAIRRVEDRQTNSEMSSTRTDELYEMCYIRLSVSSHGFEFVWNGVRWTRWTDDVVG
jgi:hypothetical protein